MLRNTTYIGHYTFHDKESGVTLTNDNVPPIIDKKLFYDVQKRMNGERGGHQIKKVYLWNKLDKLHQSNHCFTDFTHPRQINVINHWQGLVEAILLGHWGDVLFDKQTDSDDISYDEQLIQLKRKISLHFL